MGNGFKPTVALFTQISWVFKHPAKKDLYIALADRWITEYIPGMPREYKEVARLFEAYFNPELEVPKRVETIDYQFNTSVADYVWLPFRFEGKMAYLDWQDEWRVEDYD